jgi:hypothetical protein
MVGSSCFQPTLKCGAPSEQDPTEHSKLGQMWTSAAHKTLMRRVLFIVLLCGTAIRGLSPTVPAEAGIGDRGHPVP